MRELTQKEIEVVAGGGRGVVRGNGTGGHPVRK